MKPLAFHRRLPFIFVFAIGRLIDLVTTRMGISIGKMELNPLVHAFGMNSLYVFDLVLLVGFVLMAWKIKTLTVDVFLACFAMLVCAAAVWNVIILQV